MNCAEFQRLLPDTLEGERGADEAAHLKACAECAGLVADLEAITALAETLQASEEPSPRVWNSIEIALRQEGIIRDAEPVPERRRGWRMGLWRPGWLAPLAAGFALTFGVLYFIQHRGTEVQTEATAQKPVAAPVAVPPPGGMDDAADQRVLEIVGTRVPAMRADYAANLTTVNNYIRDARMGVEANPNDEEARQALMEAYQQKEMVYEMALDHSLP